METITRSTTSSRKPKSLGPCKNPKCKGKVRAKDHPRLDKYPKSKRHVCDTCGLIHHETV